MLAEFKKCQARGQNNRKELCQSLRGRSFVTFVSRIFMESV